ncbi:hypothetical protein ABIB90_002741 [Bradyrhizobium sp. JR4.1]|uniref:hypothetical protein n=1 Tax=Bradyrhizobium sp. JR4.1 TaxID=3156372 RepID=UPI003395E2DF
MARSARDNSPFDLPRAFLKPREPILKTVRLFDFRLSRSLRPFDQYEGPARLADHTVNKLLFDADAKVAADSDGDILHCPCLWVESLFGASSPGDDDPFGK